MGPSHRRATLLTRNHMHHAIRYHDRLLAGLSRRQLLNIAWKLGAAALLHDKRETWATTSVLPADGALVYENEQLLVKLAP